MAENDVEQALRSLHTPETFGRAVVDAVLRAGLTRNERNLEATFSIGDTAADGSIPVCFFLFSHEICVNIPIA